MGLGFHLEGNSDNKNTVSSQLVGRTTFEFGGVLRMFIVRGVALLLAT